MAKKKDGTASGGKPSKGSKNGEGPAPDPNVIANALPDLEPEEDPRDIDPEDPPAEEVHPIVAKAHELRESFVSLRERIPQMNTKQAALDALSGLATQVGALASIASEHTAKWEQTQEALIGRIERLERDIDDRDAVIKKLEAAVAAAEPTPDPVPATPKVADSNALPKGWVHTKAGADSKGPCVSCGRPVPIVNPSGKWQHPACAEELRTKIVEKAAPGQGDFGFAAGTSETPKKTRGGKKEAAVVAAAAPAPADAVPTPAPDAAEF